MDVNHGRLNGVNPDRLNLSNLNGVNPDRINLEACKPRQIKLKGEGDRLNLREGPNPDNIIMRKRSLTM